MNCIHHKWALVLEGDIIMVKCLCCGQLFPATGELKSKSIKVGPGVSELITENVFPAALS